MAIGVENKTITFQYLGEPSKYGGRRPIAKEVVLDVFWNENLSQYYYRGDLRFRDGKIKAQIVIAFEETFEKPNPDLTRIKDNDKYYKIESIDVMPTDFGVDGTYVIMVSDYEGDFA